MKLLLAEDETALADWMVRALTQSGSAVDWVADGRLVSRALRAERYDALILDLGLPGLDGEDVLANLREDDEALPVLVLTARDTLAQRVSTLRGGADDFMAKPFEIEELEARLLALVRRARSREPARSSCGSLSFDPAAKRFQLGAESLTLTPREHALLSVLIRAPGQPVGKAELMQQVFPGDAEVNPEAVEVVIHRLRKRLLGSDVQVTTMRGLGYVLEAVGHAP